MHQKGFCVIDYSKDCISIGILTITHASMPNRLTVSDKKMVSPGTKVVCLGVLNDTKNVTVSIPPDKLHQMNDRVRQWLIKEMCNKHQLQSILGIILYVHKCIRPACIFLNYMLAVLRSGHASQKSS